MAKYQRPVCILTKKEETDRLGTYLTYQGSARGCDKVGITDFKNICTETGAIMYAEGHQRSFWFRYCSRKY